MEEIYEYENINEIKEAGNLIANISYKPMTTIYVVMIVGLACIIFFHNTFGYVFGAFNIIMASIVYFKVKDHKVMDIYDDALILFDNNDETRVIRLPINDVKEWNVNRNQSYLITLKLINDEEISAQSFEVNKAQKALTKALPNKSTDDIVRAKMKKQKAAGFSLGRKK